MTERVLIGKRGSDYGLFVAKPGISGALTSMNRKDLIFDSTDLRTSAIHGIKEVTISSGSTNGSVNLNSDGSSLGFIPFILWTQVSGNDILGQPWHFSFSFSGPSFTIGNNFICEVTNTAITIRNPRNGTSAATFKCLVFAIPAE
jgi:hypothetical protein|tara:strand:+ start:370 stop:804 length:435 start_codon:yes stop_codon:yes gene_type:complete